MQIVGGYVEANALRGTARSSVRVEIKSSDLDYSFLGSEIRKHVEAHLLEGVTVSRLGFVNTTPDVLYDIFTADYDLVAHNTSWIHVPGAVHSLIGHVQAGPLMGRPIYEFPDEAFATDEEVYLVLGRSNWCHLLIDFLPHLVLGLLAQRQGLIGPVRFLVDDQNPLMDKLLADLPEAASRAMKFPISEKPRTVLKLRRAWVPQALHLPNGVDLVRSFLLQELPPSGPPCPEKVFNFRGSDPRLSNSAELIEIASRHGFTAVDFAKLTVREQVAHAFYAKVMVGVHGAGLTNLIFMRRGATVIELVGEKLVHNPGIADVYQKLAACSCLNYFR